MNKDEITFVGLWIMYWIGLFLGFVCPIEEWTFKLCVLFIEMPILGLILFFINRRNLRKLELKEVINK